MIATEKANAEISTEKRNIDSHVWTSAVSTANHARSSDVYKHNSHVARQQHKELKEHHTCIYVLVQSAQYICQVKKSIVIFERQLKP